MNTTQTTNDGTTPIEIDFGTLRSCLAQIGCADVEAVVDWFDSSVDEQDAMRRSQYCYVAMAVFPKPA